MSSRKYIIFEVLLPLVFAGLIYLGLRPKETLIYQIFDSFGGGQFLLWFRNLFTLSSFPEWFIYSLPGGLWLLSFQNSITWFNNFSGRKLFLSIIFSLSVGVGLEVFQFLNITDGRFDWVDIAFYLGATLISLSNVWLVRKKWEIYSSESISKLHFRITLAVFTVMIYLADIV